jgi:hypothetical protein
VSLPIPLFGPPLVLMGREGGGGGSDMYGDACVVDLG